MSKDYAAIALKHAPVLKQKVSKYNSRGDFITRVDLAGDLEGLVDNWAFVSNAGNKLPAAGYYSVVETTTHYFILYAFYHGQDWYDGDFWIDKIRKNFDEHLHDMEGALAVVTKREDEKDERVDAFITVSHFHFYCYAGWKRTEKKNLYPGDEWEERIQGFRATMDGNIWPTKDGDRTRFTLYAQAKGHGIRGDRKKWGPEKHIIYYYPSTTESEVPDSAEEAYKDRKKYRYQEARYKLIDFHEPGGLWGSRRNMNVFQANAKGQDAFVIPDKNDNRTAGSANPPWGWDDIDDRHKCGELAINPALLVHNYLDGLREFSLEYAYNPYLGIGRVSLSDPRNGGG